MNATSRKQKGMKNSVDNILDDLLAEDQHVPPRKTAAPRALSQTKPRDEDFYRQLSAMAENDADTSDMSDADLSQITKSIAGLDDMDADLFGPSGGNKRGGAKKQTTPRRVTTPRTRGPAARTSSPGSKSPVGVGSPTRADPPSIPQGSASRRHPPKAVSPPPPIPENKPGTAPGKLTDLGVASENLKPGEVKKDVRPQTVPKAKPKYDFGEFDEDDPLKGLISDEDSSRLDSARNLAKLESQQPTKNMQKEGAGDADLDLPAPLESQNAKQSSQALKDLASLLERPPTQSGNGRSASEFHRGDICDLSKSGGKKDEIIFSDDDELLGFDDKTKAKPADPGKAQQKQNDDDDKKQPFSFMDSLLGKDPQQEQQSQPQREFVLDRKYTKPVEEGEDFMFGSYQPSAASGSRPSSRRSVRFQDDDIFGADEKTPSRSVTPVKKPSEGSDWLKLALGEQTKPAVSPKPVAPASSSKTLRNSADWLGLQNSDSEEEFFKPTSSSARKVPESSPSPQITNSALQSQPGTLQNAPPPLQASVPTPAKGVTSFKPDSVNDKVSLPKNQSDAAIDGLLESASPLVGNHGVSPSHAKRQLMEDFLGLGKEIPVDDLLVSKPEDPRFRGDLRTRDDLNPDLFATPSSRPARSSQWESAARRGRHSGPLEAEDDIFAKGRAALLNDVDVSPTKARLGLNSSQLSQLGRQSGQDTTQTSLPPSTPATPFFPDAIQSQFGPMTNHHDSQVKVPSASTPGHKLRFLQELQLSSNVVPMDEELQSNKNLNPSLHSNFELQGVRGGQHVLLTEKDGSLARTLQDPQYQHYTSLLPQTNYIRQTKSVFSNYVAGDLPANLPEAHAKIRKLEIEKYYGDSLLEGMRKRLDEEIEEIERSYRNRIQILEESNQKKEARLRSDNEQLMETYLSKIRLLEQEKADQAAQHYKKLEDLERSKVQDIERLKEQHRLILTELKREQEDAIDRIRQAKNVEINAVTNVSDTSKYLSAVVEQIQTNAKDLTVLQAKVEMWNKMGLDEREVAVRSKDEQLNMLQTRLTKQEEDNERERQRLEDLIAKMETQLRQQTQGLDEERWKLKQELARQESQTRALEEERRLWAEQQARERLALDRAREIFLEEQRSSLSQISEERRAVTDEKTRFAVDQKIARDRMQQDCIKAAQAQAEYDVLMKSIADERNKESTRVQHFRQEEDRINNERSRIEQEKIRLDIEKEKLASLAEQVRQKSSDIDKMTDIASRTQQEGERAIAEALHIRTQHSNHQQEFQQQTKSLRAIEEHIAQEKLKLAKERKDVENLKNSSLCANCRNPLHPGVPRYQGGVTSSAMMVVPQGFASLPFQPVHSSMETITASIAADRSIRLWKIQALKDQEHLEDEVMFLEGLKHSPYHKTA